MSQRINRCSHCGCDEPIHNDIDGKLYCNNCGMSLENSSVTNRNRVSKCRVDTESDVKPCPFCGRDDSISIDKYQCGDEWWHFVECEECMAKGPVGKTEQDAADAWNERAMPLTMPPHVIGEIEKAAEKIHDGVEFCNTCVAYGKCGLIGIDHEAYQCRTAIAKALARAAGWSV